MKEDLEYINTMPHHEFDCLSIKLNQDHSLDDIMLTLTVDDTGQTIELTGAGFQDVVEEVLRFKKAYKIMKDGEP